MSEDRLIVFLRAPRLGTVKTRLASTLGPETALAAYRFLVGHTLDAIQSATQVELRFTPEDAGPEISAWCRQNWRMVQQGEGSLGERLKRAAAAAIAAGASRVVLIGADCPQLSAGDIEDAFEAVRSADLVLGPATDGGYWLIGIRPPLPDVFDEIAWGSSLVFEQTMARARTLGLTVTCLRELSDVDTAADWERWRWHATT